MAFIMVKGPSFELMLILSNHRMSLPHEGWEGFYRPNAFAMLLAHARCCFFSHLYNKYPESSAFSSFSMEQLTRPEVIQRICPSESRRLSSHTTSISQHPAKPPDPKNRGQLRRLIKEAGKDEDDYIGCSGPVLFASSVRRQPYGLPPKPQLLLSR